MPGPGQVAHTGSDAQGPITPRKRNSPRKDVPYSRAKRRKNTNLTIQTRFGAVAPEAPSDKALLLATSKANPHSPKASQPASAVETTNTTIVLGPRSAGLDRAWTAPFEKAVDEGSLGSRTYTNDEMTAMKKVLSDLNLKSSKSPKKDGSETPTEPKTVSQRSSSTGLQSSSPVTTPTKPHGSTGKPRGKPWSEKEAAIFKSVMEEFTAGGKHVGEAQWIEITARMNALGVHRPVGGLRMAWCRRFRAEFDIDERFNKNKKHLVTSCLSTKKKSQESIGRDVESEETESASNEEGDDGVN
ncbi:MAG: hypothetical protein Q9227_007162 [Pyrenula ochraceoflavens]